MANLKCDNCGADTDTRGSWDAPIKILCSSCSVNETTRVVRYAMSVVSKDVSEPKCVRDGIVKQEIDKP